MTACSKKSTALNLLTLKKSPFLDSLRSSIPKLPVQLIGDSQMPGWKRLSLDSKIPLEGAFLLARRKLGQALRIESPQFDTSDPYNYEVRLEYEALHDPHLANFFEQSDHLREAIVKAGMLSSRLEVRCTLKDYNAYRGYLRSMQAKLMRLELEKRDELEKEKLILKIAEKQADTAVKKIKKEELRDAALKEVNEKREVWLRKLRQKLKDFESIPEAVKQSLQQGAEKKKIESILDRERFKKKRAVMAKKDQQILLNRLKVMTERERRLKKTLEANELMKRQMKLDKEMAWFEKKKAAQEVTLVKEDNLRNCAVKLKKTFLESYDEKINRQRQKMEDLLEESKRRRRRARKPKRRAKKAKSNGCCCRVK